MERIEISSSAYRGKPQERRPHSGRQGAASGRPHRAARSYRKERVTITRRPLIIVISVAAVLMAGIAISRVSRTSSLTHSGDDIPVARVKRGQLDLRVYTTGELEAKNSVTLSAPPVAGASLRITHLLHTGAVVKKGDVVIE